MRSLHILRRIFRFVTPQWRAAFAFLSCAPIGSSDHEYQVIGDFRSDGTCTVVVDGKPLFAPQDLQRTWVENGQIACGRLAATGGPEVSEKVNLVLAVLYKPRGGELKPGRYEVDDEAHVPDRRWHARIAVWDRRLNSNAQGVGQINGYYIAAIKGAFELTRLDSAHAVGKFAVRGKKKWSMG